MPRGISCRYSRSSYWRGCGGSNPLGSSVSSDTVTEDSGGAYITSTIPARGVGRRYEAQDATSRGIRSAARRIPVGEPPATRLTSLALVAGLLPPHYLAPCFDTAAPHAAYQTSRGSLERGSREIPSTLPQMGDRFRPDRADPRYGARRDRGRAVRSSLRHRVPRRWPIALPAPQAFVYGWPADLGPFSGAFPVSQ